MMPEAKTPNELANPEMAAFRDAARAGRFVLPHCAACGRSHWYPRGVCPFCDSTEIAFVAASGRGTIYSFSIMRRAEMPYAIAYVTLAEGPTMMTNLVDCEFDALRIGQDVVVTFRPTADGVPMPMFSPA